MLGFIIGDSEMITGFRLVGVEGTEVSSVDEAKRTLDSLLLRNDIAVIVVSQSFSSQSTMREAIDKVRRERASPIIVEVPGNVGPSGETRISDLISKTLGVRL